MVDPADMMVEAATVVDFGTASRTGSVSSNKDKSRSATSDDTRAALLSAATVGVATADDGRSTATAETEDPVVFGAELALANENREVATAASVAGAE